MLTASKLGKVGMNGSTLDVLVKGQLQAIDDSLTRHTTMWGRNTVTFELPETFAIPGLNKSDAQRFVYAMVIRDLKKRGFEVRITITTAPVILYIAWNADFDQSEVKALNDTIKDHILKPEEAPKFTTAGTSGRSTGRLNPKTKYNGKSAASATTATMPAWAENGTATAPLPAAVITASPGNAAKKIGPPA